MSEPSIKSERPLLQKVITKCSKLNIPTQAVLELTYRCNLRCVHCYIDFDESIDLVGITAQTCQAPRAYQIADEFRKRGKKTIIGGFHASFCPEEALQHFDSVLIGEAEDIWERIERVIKV